MSSSVLLPPCSCSLTFVPPYFLSYGKSHAAGATLLNVAASFVDVRFLGYSLTFMMVSPPFPLSIFQSMHWSHALLEKARPSSLSGSDIRIPQAAEIFLNMA